MGSSSIFLLSDIFGAVGHKNSVTAHSFFFLPFPNAVILCAVIHEPDKWHDCDYKTGKKA